MTAPLPAILLPPSKSQRSGGDGAPWLPGTLALPALDTDRGLVLAALADAVGAGPRAHSDPGRLLGAKGATLAEALAQAAQVRHAPTMPAIERFDGVLYGELGYAALRAATRRRLDAMVLVWSAPFGVLAPRDPIPEVRLGFEACLPALVGADGGAVRLARWWRPRLTSALSARLAGRVVWDLLPAEHAAAWAPEATECTARFTVSFVDRDGRRVTHWNKLLKGALVAWLGAAAPRELDALAGFTHPLGYRWDPGATRETSWGAQVVFRES